MVDELFTRHDGGTNLLIHVPHGSAVFPAADRTGLAISEQQLEHNIAMLRDRGVNRILAAITAERPDVSYLRSNRSRFWVDVERFDDPAEEMNTVGMGVVYTKTIDGQELYRPEHRLDLEQRKQLLYRPYHRSLTQLSEQLLAEHGALNIIDLHSYAAEPWPFELHAADPRPQICLGWNKDEQSLPLLQRLQAAFAQHFEVGVNQAYKGSIVPNGFFGREDVPLASIMVEIRQDVVEQASNISTIAEIILRCGLEENA